LNVADNFEQALAWPDFRQLYGYWRSRCEGDRLPARASIDPAVFPALLPRIYLIDVMCATDPDKFDYRFRLAGTEHFEINQIELTGLMIEEAFAPDRIEAMRSAYTNVVLTRRPAQTLGARPAVIGRSHVVYDRLLLPLASDGLTVDMLLGYLRRQPGTLSA
jgi:hypothetical protein